MRKIIIFLSIFILTLYAEGQKTYHFIGIGGIGSQTTFIKDKDINVKWSNINKELHSYTGNLSGYGAIGVELDNSQKLFTRFLLEVSRAKKIPNIPESSYIGYGISVEEGYRISPWLYVFGGPGLHYATLKADGTSAKGLAVNVNLGFGFPITSYANLQIMARGSFPVGENFRSLGINGNGTIPLRLDYFASIVVRL